MHIYHFCLFFFCTYLILPIIPPKNVLYLFIVLLSSTCTVYIFCFCFLFFSALFFSIVYEEQLRYCLVVSIYLSPKYILSFLYSSSSYLFYCEKIYNTSCMILDTPIKILNKTKYSKKNLKSTFRFI